MTIRELPHNEYLFTPYSFGRSKEMRGNTTPSEGVQV